MTEMVIGEENHLGMKPREIDIMMTSIIVEEGTVDPEVQLAVIDEGDQGVADG